MKTLAEQVRAFMDWKSRTSGVDFTPALMASLVARFQHELPQEKRCTRQNIEGLLLKDLQTPRYLVALAKAMGTTAEILKEGKFAPVPSAQLTTPPAGDAQRQPIDLSNNPDYPAVRRVQFKLSAGATGFGVDYLGEDDPPIVFKRAWFVSNGYRPEALFAVRVANGSMEPGLYDGDTVVVNTGQTEAKDGKVFAVNYEGELVIKRLVRDAGQWWLCSDNPDQRHFPRKQAHAGAILLGEIVHKQSERI